MNEIDILRGKSKPFITTCVIAVCDKSIRQNLKQSYLIISEYDLYENGLLDGPDLIDNTVTGVPEKPGIYKCKLEIHTWKSSNPDQIEEWDMSIAVTDATPCSLMFEPKFKFGQDIWFMYDNKPRKEKVGDIKMQSVYSGGSAGYTWGGNSFPIIWEYQFKLNNSANPYLLISESKAFPTKELLLASL